MRLLVLTAYYPPEVAASLYLTENLLEDLVKIGCEIELYTPMPTRGVSDEIRNEYKNRKYEEKYQGKLKIHRFSMVREPKNTVLRAIRYLSTCVAYLCKGLAAKSIDLIYVSSTPPILGPTAAFLKKLKKVPMVYNVQDVFPDSLVTTGLTRRDSLLWSIGRIIEDYTYRHSNRIIVISEGFGKNLVAKGVEEEKIEVVRNWADDSSICTVDRNENVLIDRYGLDKDKFYIVYCGNIGFTQNMRMLVSVAHKLQNYEEIQFVLIGDGAGRAEVERLILEKALSNIRILPFQPYEDISDVFSLGDVGLVISKAGVGTNSIPSKTWNIMLAARTVLASFDLESELNSAITEAECGICVAADDAEALACAILELYTTEPAVLNRMGENGRAFVLQRLARASGTEKYVRVLKEALSNNQ